MYKGNVTNSVAQRISWTYSAFGTYLDAWAPSKPELALNFNNIFSFHANFYKMQTGIREILTDHVFAA
jgi:hypothetical protein